MDVEHERWVTGITKDDHVNYHCSNLHNHTIPKPCKVPSVVQNAIKQAVHSNPGLTPSMISPWQFLLLHILTVYEWSIVKL